MEDIKCSDFFIIKLRNYADEKLMKKWSADGGGVLPKQFYERNDLYNKFFYSLITHLTNETIEHWTRQYMFDLHTCLRDEIHESHDILIHCGEGWQTYFIPLEHTELIEWFKANINLPFKLLKKTNLGFWAWRGGVNKTRREDCRERSIKFITENNL